MSDNEPSGVRSVHRAAEVLRVFEDGREHRVTEIASRIGTSPSTTHRLLRTLCNTGLLEQSGSSTAYRLGLASALLGRAAIDRFAGGTVDRELRRLHATTGEGTSFGIPGNGYAHVLLRIRSDPTPTIERDTRGGPAHACVLGKVFLAWEVLSFDDLPEPPYQRFTPTTITDPETLRADIDATRHRGYALLDGERLAGSRAVAVPTHSRDGHVTGAISTYGDASRFTDAYIESVLPLLRDTAARIRGGSGETMRSSQVL
ncbi:MAG: IclR family transcriptional regulator [Gordonia sp. (in: high G+C Gram-positive bacteria)]